MLSKLIFLLVLLVCTGEALLNPLEGMKNFAALKMANYSNYLTANGMDPSPINSKPQYFKASNLVANLSVTISNQAVRGHSNDISVKNIDSFIEEILVTSHLITMDFETSGNVTFFGDYTLNGTVNSTIPINSEGIWHISVPVVYFNTCQIIFALENESISSLNSVKKLHFGDEPVYDIFFENLFDNDDVIGLEEDIEEALFTGFSEYITSAAEAGWWPEFPIKRLYINYWNDVLWNTTLEEIYGTTVPPTKVI